MEDAKLYEIDYRLVDFIPKDKKFGILYICDAYSVTVHKCACGCGVDVVTPFGDDKSWALTITDKVSLSPSIGNFRYPCKSHYFITEGKIKWCT